MDQKLTKNKPKMDIELSSILDLSLTINLLSLGKAHYDFSAS